MAKIRTLEMEVHFSYRPEADDEENKRMPEKDRLENRVRIMERLLEHFEVTGSTMEVYRQMWHPEQ
eukprot:12521738-Heterocapsa_arctica.AAC.1